MNFGFPDVGDIVDTVIGKIASIMWGFFGPLLAAVFGWIDKITTPTIVYTPNGPLGAVYPIMLWLGIVLAIGFGFAQVGLVALNGTRSLFALLKGLAQYMLLNGTSLAILSLVSALAGATATGIIQVGYGVDSWKSLGDDANFGQKALNGMTGISLFVLVVAWALPFTLGLIMEMVIRQGAMEVLAATFPIVAAGLIHEKFARWYWTALRWMLALIFMLPVIALSMVIGHSIAMGAGTSAEGGASAKVLQALIGGFIGFMSLTAPYFLFKLFAFIDPNTISGQSFRGSLPQGLKGGGGSDTAGDENAAEGTSDSGAGAKEAALLAATGGASGGAEVAGAEGAGAGGAAGGGLSGSGSMMDSASAALGSYGKVGDAADKGGGRASTSLDNVGAGHGNTRGGTGSSDGVDSDDFAGEVTGPMSGGSGSSNSPSRSSAGHDLGGESDASPAWGGASAYEEGADSSSSIDQTVPIPTRPSAAPEDNLNGFSSTGSSSSSSGGSSDTGGSGFSSGPPPSTDESVNDTDPSYTNSASDDTEPPEFTPPSTS